jgi:hypothetical protein
MAMVKPVAIIDPHQGRFTANLLPAQEGRGRRNNG